MSQREKKMRAIFKKIEDAKRELDAIGYTLETSYNSIVVIDRKKYDRAFIDLTDEQQQKSVVASFQL